MKSLTILTAVMMTVLVGCSSTSNVKPSYVSPTQYQHLNCQQLHTEYQRLSSYIQNGIESSKGSNLGVSFGLGGGIGRGGAWGLFPSISITPKSGGNRSVERQELAKLYGQQDAIVQASNFKNCPIAVQK